MSYTYELACVPCRTILDLGKLVESAEDSEYVPEHFGGWKGGPGHSWLGGTDLLKSIERFMIHHRGHEIRLIPETLLANVDDDEVGLHYIDSSVELFDQPIDPPPDPYDDLARIPADVTKLLQSPPESP